MLRVNVHATTQTVPAILPALKVRSWGRFVNVTSLTTVGIAQRLRSRQGRPAGQRQASIVGLPVVRRPLSSAAGPGTKVRNTALEKGNCREHQSNRQTRPHASQPK